MAESLARIVHGVWIIPKRGAREGDSWLLWQVEGVVPEHERVGDDPVQYVVTVNHGDVFEKQIWIGVYATRMDALRDLGHEPTTD